MEPIALAQAALTLIGPYVAKGAEGIAAELGKKTLSAAGALLKGLRDRWKAEPAAEAALQGYIQDPTRGRETLAMTLAVQLAADPTFRNELERLLQGSSPEVFLNVTAKDADQVTGAEVTEMTGGKMFVELDVQRVKKVESVKIGKLG